MTVQEAIDSQPYDEPAKVEPPKLDLEAIRRRAEAATPGPWVRWEEHGEIVASPPNREVFKNTPGEMRGGMGTVCEFEEDYDDPEDASYNWEANAEFVAHAREDVPALLAEVTRQRGVIQRLLDQNGEMAVVWKKRLDERDEARKWARSAMTVLLEQESCGDPEEDEEAREVLARWEAETAEPKKAPTT